MSIPNPVPGGTFTDTFGAPRSGGRKHAGVDIFAPLGAPIIAPIGGTIAVAGNDGGAGGNRVWLVGDDGRAYYFAHLQNIVVRTGQKLRFGEQLGTVGKTGNAQGTSPHLHFSINGKVGGENPIVNPFLEINRAQRVTPAPLRLPEFDGERTATGAARDARKASEGGIWGDGCLIGADPFGKVPFLGGAEFCFSRANARAIIGGLTVVAGGVIMLGGAFLIVGGAAVVGRNPIVRAGTQLAGSGARRQEEQEAADLRAAERQARMTAAQNRQEAAERAMVRRRQSSTPGAGSGPRRAARRAPAPTGDF